MYKGIIDTATAVAANIDIPFKTEFNTNRKTVPADGAVAIVEPGFWNVKAQLNFTYTSATSGNVSFQFYDNGEPIPEARWTWVASQNDVITATIMDLFRVVRTYTPSLAKLSVRATAPVTVNSAVFIVDQER